MNSLALLLLVGLASVPLVGDDSERILTIDHFVRVQSSVPAISGQPTQLYVRERVHAGHARTRFASGRSRGAVRARGRHAGRSGIRCAVSGLQLDGVPRAGGVRRLLGRHDRLRPLDAPGSDERSVQPRTCPTSLIHPASHPRSVSSHVRPGDLTSIASDWADVGAAVDYIRALARRGARQPRRMVARRPAFRWLRRQESTKGSSSRVARTWVQSRGPRRSASQGSGRRRGVQHAVACGVRCELGSTSRLPRSVREACG